MRKLQSYVGDAKDFLRTRRQAYCDVFNKNDQAAVRVLVDLAAFCRASESTFHTDPRVHAALEGRREVWLRIQQHLQLSDEELWELFSRKG